MMFWIIVVYALSSFDKNFRAEFEEGEWSEICVCCSDKAKPVSPEENRYTIIAI